MQIRTGLNMRIVGAAIVLAFLVMGTFGLMISTIQSLRGSAGEAQHSEQVVGLANRLERLALDLETGMRGYVITRQAGFLQPLRHARAEYPLQARHLERLVREDPVQLARARAIEVALREYQLEWADPLVAAARRDGREASTRVTTAQGKALMDGIRRRFDTFVAAQQHLSAQRAAESDDQGRRAVLLGAFAIGGSALLILVFASSLFRLVTVPVRRIADGARRLSTGDLAARVPERGIGEIGGLARDFNAMAESLGEKGGQLRRQNAELQAVLDATLDGILMTDNDGNVLFSNRTIDRFWAEAGLPDDGTIWDRMARLARRTTTPDAYYEVFARIAADPTEAVDADFTLADTKRTFTGHTAAVRDSSGGAVVGSSRSGR
jgi:CHASE3 domain sensor protein